MHSCVQGPSYLSANQAPFSYRSMRRQNHTPSYYSNESSAVLRPAGGEHNTSTMAAEQERRRENARRTLIEVLSEALELIGDDGLSDSTVMESLQ